MESGESSLACEPQLIGGNGQRCLICADVTVCHNHFGALSCNSCRAFFRRSVVAGSKFVCRRKGACVVQKSDKKMCSSCRHRRCVEAGMNEEKVMCVQQAQAACKRFMPALASVPDSEQLGSRDWITAIRCGLVGGTAEGQLARPNGVVEAYSKEAMVHFEYLCRLDASFYSPLSDNITPRTLTEATFSGWNMFESALATLCNDGRKYKRFYMVNGHYVAYNERGLVSFCSEDPEIRDAHVVGRYFYEKLDTYMNFVAGLKKAAPDNLELLTLWHLFVAQNHRSLFKSPTSRQFFVNSLLTNLYKHYSSTYKNYANRMARISILLQQFLALKQSIDEVDVFIELNSRTSMTSEVACSNHQFTTTWVSYANCPLMLDSLEE